jgi:hypothetical protein
MDMMADYKIKALANMKQTVDTLTSEIEKSKTYVDRIRKAEAANEAAGIESTSEVTL